MRFERHRLRLAQGLAFCLLFGMLVSVWLRGLDAVAGRTAHAWLAGWTAVAGGLGMGILLFWLPARGVARRWLPLTGLLLIGACWLAFQPWAAVHVLEEWQGFLIDSARTFGGFLAMLGRTAGVYLFLTALFAGACGVFGWTWWFEGRQAPLMGLAATAALLAGFLAGRRLICGVDMELFARWASLGWGALATAVLLTASEARPRRAWRMGVALLPLVGVGLLLIVARPRPSAPPLMSAGRFALLVHRDSGFAAGRPFFRHIAGGHAISVYADPDYQFVLTLDGRPVLFGNRFHGPRALTAYAPLLARPHARRALMIGPEVGLYLPFLARAGIQDLSVFETHDEVLRLLLAADAYLTGDEQALGASVARLSSRSWGGNYDLIFIAPEPAWIRGGARLYGKSWLRRCRQALAPNGVAALRLDARALPADRFMTLARDFQSVFPFTQIWRTGSHDWVLLGAVDAFQTDAAQTLKLLEHESVFRDFTRAGGLSLADALASFVSGSPSVGSGLDARGQGARATSWRAPQLAVRAGPDLFCPRQVEPFREHVTTWLLRGEADEDVFEALRNRIERAVAARLDMTQALAERAAGHHESGLLLARNATVGNPRDVLLTQWAESIELEGRRRIRIGDFRGALRCYEHLLSLAATLPAAHHGMGFSLRGLGETEAAYLHFARAVALAPEMMAYRLDLAQAALGIGAFDEADRQFAEILRRMPDHAEALFRSAKALAMPSRPDRDLEQAVKLAERACALTRWKNLEYALGLADLYIEAGRVLEGMGLKRRIKEGGLDALEAP